ncbi:MAG: NINE protein [Deltaproteobacteria bacterium]|nr:MAG: NINE protein [Deltaproteobacteria bacterium]
MKSKTFAVILAFFLGGIGAHKFYLGRPGQGLLYLFFCWTGIPSIAALIDAVVLLSMSDQAFQAKYNGLPMGMQPPQMAPTQNIVVNIPSAAGVGGEGERERERVQIDVVTQIEKLHQLRIEGALTEEEFQAQKRKLLSGPS